MEPLQSFRRISKWIGIYQNPDETRWNGAVSLVLFATSVMVQISTALASLQFIVRFLSTDFETCLNCLYPLAGSMSVTYSLLSTFFLRQKVDNIFVKLTHIFYACEDAITYRFLERANNQSESIWRNYFKFMVCGFLIHSIVTPLISVISCFKVHGHFAAEFVLCLYKFALPWNQRTPIGYFAEICFSIVVGVHFVLVNGLFLLFFVAICLHHQAFHNIVKHSFDQLHDGNGIDKQFLSNLIRFQLTIKDWFQDSAEVYCSLILVQLISSTIFMASSIFLLDSHLRDLDNQVIHFSIAVIFSTFNLFVYCFFGRLATDSYLKMAESSYESDWIRTSIELQKYIVLMIANMQKPLYYHGFSVVVLNLETFSGFLKKVMTFYMMFKTLTE